MIRCPICGAKSIVTKVKPRSNGSAYRRRKCSSEACQAVFSTSETVIGGSENAISSLLLLETLEELGVAIDYSEIRSTIGEQKFFPEEQKS